MEHDNKHIEGQEPLSPLEQWELQSALNREHASAPDVEAAWHDVCQQLELPAVEQEEETSHQTTPSLWHRARPYINWAAGIAAVLALMVGYHFWSGSQVEPRSTPSTAVSSMPRGSLSSHCMAE